MSLANHLKQLRAMCAVAAFGSTAQASAALHLTQPSVARAIQELEAAVGLVLFDRVARGMQLRADAMFLVNRVRRMLQHLMQAAPARRRHDSNEEHAWTTHRVASGVTGRHIEVFLWLCATGSQTQTAQSMGTSQSAVHQTLAQLEHMAGGPLFLRARGGLRLTSEGEQAEQAFQLARAELQHADEELALKRGAPQSRLVIGTLPFSTGRLLSEAVDRVLQTHPGLSVTIIDGTFDSLIQRLRRAEIDLLAGALRPQPPAADLHQQMLFEDRLVVVARAAHPLAQRQRLSWRDLRMASWIMPMPNTPAQIAFEQALNHAGIALPADPLRVNSALMMLALLAQSDRLALMSRRQIERELAGGQLKELPVRVVHEPRQIGLVCRGNYLPTPAAKALIDTLHQVGRTIQQEANASRGHP